MDGGWMRKARFAAVLAAGASLAACATVGPEHPVRPQGAGGRAETYKVGRPYQVGGVWYTPREQPDYDETGVASWYGEAFHNKTTANGEPFDMDAISAAHTTLPLPSLVEVTNLDNGRRLVVRVNDRGPFVGGRIIDLSREAARELGYDRRGLARVRVRYVGRAPLRGAPDQPPAELNRRMASNGALETGGFSMPAPIVPPPSDPPSEPAAPASPSAASAPQTPSTGGSAAGARGGYRIQLGAFSDPLNARRAAAAAASAGQAVIEPFIRGGDTLYRVLLDAPADEAKALALRDQVAGLGFSGAMVVGPAGL